MNDSTRLLPMSSHPQGFTPPGAARIPAPGPAALAAVDDAQWHTQDNTELLNQALELSHAGIWKMDLTQTQAEVWLHPRTRQILGLLEQPGDCIPATLWLDPVAAATGPLEIQEANHHLAMAMRGESPGYDCTYPFKRPVDGRTIWLRAVALLARDAQSRPRLLRGIVSDITEARQKEQSLLEATQRAELALKVVKTGSWTVDLVNHPGTTYYSAEAALLLGTNSGQPYWEDDAVYYERMQRIAPDSLATFRARYALLEAGKIDGYDYIFPYVRMDDDSRLWVRIVTTAARNSQGKLTRITGVIRDITDERAREQELEKAKEDAIQAAQAKSDFLANMSHEIRTPMNAILGLSHLLFNTALSPLQRSYLEKIQSSGTHLLGVVNDILDFSKVESGNLQLELDDFVLDQMLENLAPLISEKAQKKNLELLFDVASDVPQNLRGDTLRLGQILINFANNAIKFTERGEVCIRVALQEPGASEVTLLFEVIDSGIGLSQEQIGRLFQSFSQADTSTTRKYGGTGLGLAISKQLALRMGGEVGVRSQPGQGSTFWFTARLQRGLDAAPALLPEDLRARHVLVVDDHAQAARILCAMVGDLQLQASSVSSGAEALALVRQWADTPQAVDLLLLDWQMPQQSGKETTAAIHALKLARMPQIVPMRVLGEEEPVQSADAGPTAGTLAKPATPSMVRQAILRAFGRAPLPQNASTAPDLGALAGARILLVEDNELNQLVASELLRGVGMLVDVADNGQIAVDQVCSHATPPWDLVLMDMQMPVMDGISATVEIRKRYPATQLPIVAMTANVMQQDRERCLQAGMQDFVSKPIDPPELWRVLGQWIAARAGLGAIEGAGSGASNPPALLEALPDIQVAGLDTRLGLSRVLNNQVLYLQLLRKFVTSQGQTWQALQDALAQGDTTLAERLAHTLKSVAGSIGAAGVQELAASVEHLVHGSTGDASLLHAAMQALQQPLDLLIAELTAQIPAAHQTQPMTQPLDDDPALQAEAIAQLLALLQQDDSVAIDFFYHHSAQLQRTLGTDFETFQHRLEDFEFDTALAMLKTHAMTGEMQVPAQVPVTEAPTVTP